MTYYSKNFSHMMKRRAEKLRGIKYPKADRSEHASKWRGMSSKGGKHGK